MKKSLIALASVLAIVAGCAKENLGEGVKAGRTHSGIKEVSGTIVSDQTKTYLNTDDGYKLYWIEEETISVGSGENFVDFTLTEGADSPKGKFESSEDLPEIGEEEYYFAVSPAMTDLKSDADTVYVTYPSELNYMSESGCAEGGEIMVGKSHDSNFAIRNAVGYIKFQLAVTEDEAINKIEVSRKSFGRLAGTARVIFDGSKIDTVKFPSGAATTVTVKFDETVTISTSEPFVTYIPVAPMPDGISITVTMASGKAATLTSSSPVCIGQVLELPVATFTPKTVAKVGETEYYSINQAVEAANDFGGDATITLLGDCNVGENCEILSPNHEITIDLAGYTLKSVGSNILTVASGTKACIITDSSEGKTGMITNTNSGNSPIKIKGHTILRGATLEGYYGANISNGSFILEDGLVHGVASCGIYVKTDTESSIDSVVILGGKIISDEDRGVQFNSKGKDDEPNLIFRGGELQSVKAGVYMYDGNVAIYGGTFGAKSNVIYATRSSSYTNQVDIYGGFFHRDSSDNAIVYGHTTTDSTRVWGGYYNVGPSLSYVPDGYEVGVCDTTVNGINYTATIIKSTEVACELQIGSGAPVQKATVNEAFETAKAQSEPATVRLLADCATKDSIGMFNGHKFTLDLNGYTLTTAGTKVFHVNETGAVLTIKSSQEGGMMFESATGSNSLIVRGGGKVILESGCLKGNNTTAGHMYINGGEFIMNGGEIWTPEYNPVSLAKGTFTMNGGTLRTDAAETYCIKVNGGSAKFNGGSFVSKTSSYKIYVATEATIDGTFDAIAVSGAGKVSLTGGNYTGATHISASDMTITGGTFVNDTSQAIYVYSGGSVTISNATISGGSKYGSLRSLGSTTIEEGTTVTSTNEEEGTAIYVGSDATAGSITVNGGKFSAYKTAYISNGVFAVNDGIFTSKLRAVYVASKGSAEITGGYFNTPKDSVIFTGNGAKGIAKGGWYTQPLADSLIDSAYILDSSKSKEAEGVTYNYTVIENAGAPDVATVNTKAYKTFDSALSAATTALSAGNTTLKLLADCASLSTYAVAGSNTLTIDLNGKKLEMAIVSTGNLKITDSSAEGTGQLAPSEGKAPLTINAGTTTVEKGTVSALSECAVMVQGDASNKATFNFTGGEIKSNTTVTATASTNGGAVCVIDNSEFNMTDGIIRGEGKRALWSRSFVDGTAPVSNISGGTLIAAGNVFYSYTRAKYNISGGLFITKGATSAVCHNGTSNTAVAIKISGGYFYTENTYVFTGYNTTSCSKYTYTGGCFNANPKMKYTYPSSTDYTFTPASGYSVVSTSETKEFDGVTYTFTHKVAAN